jgi:hypothetical protein
MIYLVGGVFPLAFDDGGSITMVLMRLTNREPSPIGIGSRDWNAWASRRQHDC